MNKRILVLEKQNLIGSTPFLSVYTTIRQEDLIEMTFINEGLKADQIIFRTPLLNIAKMNTPAATLSLNNNQLTKIHFMPSNWNDAYEFEIYLQNESRKEFIQKVKGKLLSAETTFPQSIVTRL